MLHHLGKVQMVAIGCTSPLPESVESIRLMGFRLCCVTLCGASCTSYGGACIEYGEGAVCMQAFLYPLAFQGHGKTLRVRKTQAGVKYFVFEGMRFIVDNGKLSRASFEVGASYMDYHQASIWHKMLSSIYRLSCCKACLCICGACMAKGAVCNKVVLDLLLPLSN